MLFTKKKRGRIKEKSMPALPYFAKDRIYFITRAIIIDLQKS